MSKLNFKKGMTRIAIVLTVLDVLFWIIAQVFNPGGDWGLLFLGFVVATVAAIWALYGLVIGLVVGLVPFISRGFTDKTPEKESPAPTDPPT